ncbi:MAG TPA: serine/threonine-protein kinase [Thermoanaerobaculia bacterium]|nr:serine/threonine-protein kinase [Thermoanaerobaculia bacterium]
MIGPGGRIGRFEISRTLGRGAMGTVYLARDPRIDREVAVKTLRDPSATPELAAEVEARFHNEAKIAGRLQHPNVVTIYEAGREEGVLYIVMEYVDGEPLNRYAASRSLDVAQKIELIRQAALALGHAHEKGVLHRDVKPGNILVTRDGQVKVADFGIGKLVAGEGGLTRTGQLVGSPAYMSPEQIRGGPLDPRSDLFSLGVVLYELLTGIRPFPGNSMTTLVYQILHTDARDPLAAARDLPPVAREIFARLLAKSPDGRPADAAEFTREIARIGRADARRQAEAPPAPPVAPPAAPRVLEPSAASPPPAQASASPAPRAAPPLPGRAVAAAVAVLAAVALIALLRGRAKPAAPPGGGGTTAGPATPGLPATPVPAEGPPDAVVVAAPRAVGPPPARSGEARARIVRTPGTPADSARAGRILRTRQSVKIGVSPDQARVYLDGRYVGIADDWDDRGGGRTLPLQRDGAHRIRITLPGYRDMNVEVVRSRGAGEDTVEIGGDLARISDAPFTKLGRIDERTTGRVEFRVEPPNALVSEHGRPLGRASSFGPASPLRLTGPRVHELVISAPGRQRRTVRILVSGNAGNDRATVKLDLKD